MSNRSRNKKNTEPIDWEAVSAQDDEFKALRGFRIKDKLKQDRFEDARDHCVDVVTGRELSVEFMQRNGFRKVIYVNRRDDLGIKVPHKDFSIDAIRSNVGSRRAVDFLDCRTQETRSMNMRDWCKYWNTEPREDVFNGISLEFSKTRLDPQVTSPRIVRQIDWIDKAWPRHLKELQEESSNMLHDMMYPKVQKFVIMSPVGSYMDFHIDFGGTSVWYYVLRGHKVFWLIPPTNNNLLLYEKWVKEPYAAKTKNGFFGDQAEGCCRLDIPAGATMLLPAGWIHAVYTARDTLAFTGSFLHSFNIDSQLKVCFLEDSLGVPDKFRFPFHTEMLWYVLDRYVCCLTGKSFIDLPEEEKRRLRLEKGEHIDPNKEFVNPGLAEEAPMAPQQHVNLTRDEVKGMRLIIIYLQQLTLDSKDVPVLIPDPVSLVKEVKTLVDQHKDDDEDEAITGMYVLRWTEDDDVDEDGKSKKIIPNPHDFSGKHPENPFHQKYLAAMKAKQENPKKGGEAPRKRRARCQACEGCQGVECLECQPCRDMPKHGGPGKMKQSCVKRRCSRPMLPVAAYCSICKLDGWGGQPDPRKSVSEMGGVASGLMECLICWDITHPSCHTQEVQGQVLERLANSWECPLCIKGRQTAAQRMETD